LSHKKDRNYVSAYFYHSCQLGIYGITPFEYFRQREVDAHPKIEDFYEFQLALLVEIKVISNSM